MFCIFFLCYFFCFVALTLLLEYWESSAFKLKPHQFFSILLRLPHTLTSAFTHIWNNMHVCKTMQFTFMAHLYYYPGTNSYMFRIYSAKEIFWSALDVLLVLGQKETNKTHKEKYLGLTRLRVYNSFFRLFSSFHGVCSFIHAHIIIIRTIFCVQKHHFNVYLCCMIIFAIA